MDYGELMAGGFKLMVFGMGMVYVFLVIMIGAMKVLEVVLRPFATLLDPPAAEKPAAKKPAASSADAQLAAVAAAVVAKMIKK
jgi:oxaloacetate decarboxylase gamma subunit